MLMSDGDASSESKPPICRLPSGHCASPCRCLLPVNHVWQRCLPPTASPSSPCMDDDVPPQIDARLSGRTRCRERKPARPLLTPRLLMQHRHAAQHSLNHRLARWLLPRWRWEGVEDGERPSRRHTDRQETHWLRVSVLQVVVEPTQSLWSFTESPWAAATSHRCLLRCIFLTVFPPVFSLNCWGSQFTLC